MATDEQGAAPPKSKPRLVVRFRASVSTPDFTGVFMESGGQIDGMAVTWQSDFALSGAKNATVVTFPRKETIEIELEVPENIFTFEGEHVVLPTELRLNMMSQRMVAAINGTLVHSLAGEASDHLYNVLKAGSHSQMGLTYKTFEGHSSTLAVSGVCVMFQGEDGSYKRHPVKFQENPKLEVQANLAASVSEDYVKIGWDVRQVAVYKPCPVLHKTVYSEIVGINGRGYSLLHSIMDRDAYMTPATINALFETAIECDCCQDKVEIDAFKSATKSPGLQAAMQAKTVANATSLVVNVLMSYRADGRNVVLPTGAGFASVENWNASAPRSCLESNDCDGLALLAISLLRTAINLSSQELETYEYLRYVRNAVFPHYQVALSVLGATAAEATSADESHSSIAGHAIAVLVPTMSFLRALARTSGKGIGRDGPKYLELQVAGAVEQSRFEAFFAHETTNTMQLPSTELLLLDSWETAKDEYKELKMLSIEGTTPSSSTMYVPDPNHRVEARKAADLDKTVFMRAAPNVFRSVKRLHVGSGEGHTFYSALVELTFAADFPLWTYPNLRKLHSAATQFVLYSDIDSSDIVSVGASPSDIVMERYGVFPLVSVSSSAAEVLDVAAKKAKMDVMPPRVPGPAKLDSYQTRSLELSMNHIKKLETMLAKKTKLSKSTDGQHCVAYICAFNTLVHNPEAVGQFVDMLELIATSGVVDMKIIPGMAQDENGLDVGRFLHIDIYSPV